MTGHKSRIAGAGAVLAALLIGAGVLRATAPAPVTLDTALLVPADVGGSPPVEGGPDVAAHALPPRPCDGIRATEPLDARTQHVTVGGGHLIYEYAGRYASALDAGRVADGLRAAATRCPTGPGDIRHRIVATDRWGEHSTALTREWDGGRRRDAYLIGVAGSYLVVVLDIGDGGLATGDPGTATTIGAAALRRAGGDPEPWTSTVPTFAPPNPGEARWVSYAGEVTGAHVGARPDLVTIDISVPAGDPLCFRNAATSYLTEENETVYVNVTYETYEDGHPNRCPAKARASVDVVVSRPLGDRPIIVNNMDMWARDASVYRPCEGVHGCRAPLDHCNLAWLTAPGVPANGSSELKQCDGVWAVADIDWTELACEPDRDGFVPCTAEPRRERWFLHYAGDGWKTIDESRGAGCAGVHAAEPAFPSTMCRNLPAW